MSQVAWWADLIRRLPRLGLPPPPAAPLVPPEERDAYPSLAEDLAFLDERLIPAFHALDGQALRSQNRFFLVQLLYIVGSALAATLGAVQAALGGGQLWLGLVETLVAATLGLGSIVASAKSAQRTYFTSRLKAERLRSEYFLFLGRQGPYSAEAGRRAALVARVETIRTTRSGS